MEADYVFKIVLIGNSGVGKTCMMHKFAKNTFDPNTTSTIGVEFLSKTITLRGGDGRDYDIKAQIWDTAGQEKYRAITSAFYRGAKGIVLAYSIIDDKSFISLQSWVNEMKATSANKGGLSVYEDGTPVVLAGTKLDQAHLRRVTTEAGIEFARTHNFSFFETSSSEGDNIIAVFSALLSHALAQELYDVPSGANLASGVKKDAVAKGLKVAPRGGSTTKGIVTSAVVPLGSARDRAKARQMAKNSVSLEDGSHATPAPNDSSCC